MAGGELSASEARSIAKQTFAPTHYEKSDDGLAKALLGAQKQTISFQVGAMSYVRLAVLFGSMLLTTSCGSFTVDEHMAAAGTRTRPTRMLVVSRLGDDRDIPLLDSFHVALQSKLKDCGIETRLQMVNSMQIDGRQKLAALMHTFDPDSTMLIRQTVKVNGSTVAGNFLFTLHSQSEDRDLWKASATLSPPDGPGREFGAAAATELVRNMAADGVLRNCPKPTV